MARFYVTVRVTEEFQVCVEAPTPGAAKARVERERGDVGLDWFYTRTPSVAYEVYDLPDPTPGQYAELTADDNDNPQHPEED